MKKDFGGNTAFVTGASSGIGMAYARRLAADGRDLVLIARRREVLEELAEDLRATHGVEAEALAADLSAPEGLHAICDRVRDDRPGVLVHAAGFGTRGHLDDLDPAIVEAQVYLHDMAGLLLTRAALPGMKERASGEIVLVSSLGAFLTTAEYTVYSATKAFLNTFARGLRDELAGSGVRVQAVCPGLVKTGFMSTEFFAGFDFSAVPDAFWLSAEEVADESLRRLRKRYKPVLVAGRKNRAFLNFLQFPLLGPAVMALIGRASRKRVARGLPALF